MKGDKEKELQSSNNAKEESILKSKILKGEEKEAEKFLEEMGKGGEKELETKLLEGERKKKGMGAADRMRWFIWPFWQRSAIGKPVYFEDTGEKIGIVASVITNDMNKPVGYEIKDVKSDTTVHFPVESFRQGDGGLIFTPLWYSQAKEIVNELEFREKTLPELKDILLAGAVSREKIYGIVTKTHPEIRKIIDEGIMLRASMIARLNDLELERIEIRKNLTGLSEKRLLKEIGRRDFAREVLEARRKVRIIETNIKRCKELALRLDRLPFVAKYREIIREMPFLQDIIENVPVNIMVADRKGNLVDVNKAFLENLGYNAKDIKDKRIADFIYAEDREKILEINKKILEDEEPREIKFNIFDTNGKMEEMRGKGTIVRDEYGEPRVVLAFQRIVFEKAELKMEFIKEISHDFINPLCISKGYIHLLLEGKFGRITVKQKKQLENLRRNVMRIDDLIQDTIKGVER